MGRMADAVKEQQRNQHMILVAYACAPGEGGEPGVGWGYLQEAAARFARVSVITKSNNVSRIREFAPQNVFVYPVEGGSLWRKLKRGQRFVRTYYLSWQKNAERVVRSLSWANPSSIVHHVTFASVALPPRSVLGSSPDATVVLGPVGGTAKIPWRLAFRILPAASLFHEMARELNIWRVLHSPLLRRCLAASSLVMVQSKNERVNAPGRRITQNAAVEIEVMGGAAALMETKEAGYGESNEPIVVMSGRLQYFKGHRLAIDSLCSSNVRLRICGDGPARSFIEQHALRAGMGSRLEMLGHLDRDELFQALGSSDVLLSASLREGAPLSVVEGLAMGLPVVFLDVGAIAEMVSDERGFRVPADLGYGATVAAMKEQVEAALERSKTCRIEEWQPVTWAARGRELYDEWLPLLGPKSSAA